jgi:hypothetical protein
MGVAERQLTTGNLELVFDADKWAIGPGRDCGIIYALSYLTCFLLGSVRTIRMCGVPLLPESRD